jgi:CBS domain-containing protein
VPALARDVMDPQPVTVRPDDSIETVVRTLREPQLPGVPVVEEDGRCVGIVTEADVVLPDEQARLVHERGHNRLPVVEGDRLVGVVTGVDLLGALVR